MKTYVKKGYNLKSAGHMKGKHHTKETKEKIRRKIKGRKNMGASQRGENHPMYGVRRFGNKNPNWKGGITSVNKLLRNSLEYKLWRKAIFERDNYTCIWCGNNSSGNLNADHIKPFSDYPELRFAIDNGRTLCIECHKTTNSYLKRR